MKKNFYLILGLMISLWFTSCESYKDNFEAQINKSTNDSFRIATNYLSHHLPN